MSYTADKSHLDELINRAMDSDEIKEALERLPIDYDNLRKSVLEYEDRIWKAAAQQVVEVDLFEIRRESALANVPAFVRPLAGFLYSLLLSDRKNLEMARYKADEAVIRYGIIPQLRATLNKVFWESGDGDYNTKGKKERS